MARLCWSSSSVDTLFRSKLPSMIGALGASPAAAVFAAAAGDGGRCSSTSCSSTLCSSGAFADRQSPATAPSEFATAGGDRGRWSSALRSSAAFAGKPSSVARLRSSSLATTETSCSKGSWSSASKAPFCFRIFSAVRAASAPGPSRRKPMRRWKSFPSSTRSYSSTSEGGSKLRPSRRKQTGSSVVSGPAFLEEPCSPLPSLSCPRAATAAVMGRGKRAALLRSARSQ
mmetsp:Transcript_31408/g.91741  ORF Transcript_31408/g.91741 Transcript_31408/m.91741 type:complete len:229 (-) Transcript_31408:33-719(-)